MKEVFRVFCEKCGTKNDSSSKFCEKCGAKLDNEEEVKSSPKAVAKAPKVDSKSLKDKFNSLTKKQKLIGGIVALVVVAIIVFFIVGSQMTSVENMGKNAFTQLADKSTINNKYLSVALNSDEYFVSLGDRMKDIIESKDIKFNYKKYKVTTSKKSITVKYYDTEEEENYKVVFDIKKDGKSLLIFDKYVITKITMEQVGSYGTATLYNPADSEKIELKTIKGSKITIDGKEVKKDYIDSKKSDKENDVYVIKGMTRGSYSVEFTVGKLSFKKSIYVYSDGDNEYNLTNYMSSSYLSKDNNDEYAKVFKKYITTYYEYVNDDAKTVDDFGKKYKLTDDIKEEFADSKKYENKLESFKIGDVTVRSLYYYSSSKELTITYKVNYTYKTTSSDTERSTYDTVKATYKLSDIELPIALDYMPY